jgi:hypothetical protein
MSLPTSQRRALTQIERTLADDHPSLGPLFAVFTRLTDREAMPVTERVTAQRWRWRWRPWPGVTIVLGLAVATGMLLALSLTLPGPPMCAQGTVAAVAAHPQSVPAGGPAACAGRQNKTGGTGPAK